MKKISAVFLALAATACGGPPGARVPVDESTLLVWHAQAAGTAAAALEMIDEGRSDDAKALLASLARTSLAEGAALARAGASVGGHPVPNLYAGVERARARAESRQWGDSAVADAAALLEALDFPGRRRPPAAAGAGG